ncbi:hypothetical protein Tco_1404572 [Tanacetum coccineum]
MLLVSSQRAQRLAPAPRAWCTHDMLATARSSAGLHACLSSFATHLSNNLCILLSLGDLMAILSDMSLLVIGPQKTLSLWLWHWRLSYLNFGTINHFAKQVYGALCYLTNDSENLGKLQQKADIGIFIGYAPTKKAFQIYNRRTRRIIKTIHVDFDELTTMASEHSSSGPALLKNDSFANN